MCGQVLQTQRGRARAPGDSASIFGQIQDRVNEGQEVLAGFADSAARSRAAAGVSSGVSQEFRHAEYGIHGRTHLAARDSARNSLFTRSWRLRRRPWQPAV